MIERGKWQGVLTIARFNWPFYVSAGIAWLLSLEGLFASSTLGWKLACGLVAAGAAYFLIGSLGVSHLIYDRSDLYRWRWLERALGDLRWRSAIFCQAGFDETSSVLRAKYPAAHWQILDHYNAAQMTEASIRRARALFPPTPGTLPAVFDQWPLETASADLIFGLLAIHELRSETERGAWFAEAKRCLRTGGRILLVEHLRDGANFLAFGPGFWHFHSRASWQRAWQMSGLQLRDEFPITPWVRSFVLISP